MSRSQHLYKPLLASRHLCFWETVGHPLLLKPAYYYAGTPYTKDTGLFCRIPLSWFPQYALVFSTRSTFPSSGYGFSQSNMLSFHGHQAFPKHCCHSKFILLLAITALHRTILVRSPDEETSDSPICQKHTFRCRSLCEKYATMNAFPFRCYPG